MAGWKEVIFKGVTVPDLGMVGVAEGDMIVAGSGDFTFAVLTKGASGKFLKAGVNTVSWEDASIATLEEIGDVEAYTGNANKVLAVNGTGDDVEWVTGGGDFKSDGTIAMTGDLDFNDNCAIDMKLYTTIPATPADGHIYFDSAADKVMVYVA